MPREQVAEVYLLAANLCLALGHQRINELPGVLKLRVDDEWSLAFNGHDEERDGVPGYHCLFSRYDLPAALVGPGGGPTLGIDEDDLIKALRAAIERAGGKGDDHAA